MIALLEFFFQDFSHWLGGLVYMIAAFGAFGFGLAMLVELFRGK